MQKTLLGEAEKANKSKRRGYCALGPRKSKERRRQNEVPHDAVRCVRGVIRAANLGCPCFGLLLQWSSNWQLRKVPVKSVPGNPGSGAPNQSEIL